MSEQENVMELKKDQIDKAIAMGVPISITTYTLPANTQKYIESTISYFLEKLNQGAIKDYVLFCVNELVVNAKKANTKRILFEEHKLDIFSMTDYEKGMKIFKKEMLSNLEHYLDLQKKAGLYIKIFIQKLGTDVKIEVRNNSKMTPEEIKRVGQKLSAANKYSDLNEAMPEIMDDTEGAGLGLAIMLFMLKKIGVDTKTYKIGVLEDETVCRVIIPFDCQYKGQFKSLTKTIVDYIDTVPQFPEKILQIQNLINDPKSDIPEIAKHISDDVGLTADLLKFVNSASFGLKTKCISIEEAVKLVGLRGIQNLLYSLGTVETVSDPKSKEEQKKIWEHSYKVAYFAHNLAKNFKMRSIIDDAYVCGLLHDLGKIVFTGLQEKIFSKLMELQTEKKIPKSVIDTVTSDIQHPEIGATLTEKWSFPPQITATIRYQNNLEMVPKEYLEITAVVALANFMVYYSIGLVDFSQIHKGLLKMFKLQDEKAFKKICTNLANGFEQD